MLSSKDNYYSENSHLSRKNVWKPFFLFNNLISFKIVNKKTQQITKNVQKRYSLKYWKYKTQQ